MDQTDNKPKARPEFSRLYIFGAGGSGREIAWFAKHTWGPTIDILFLVDDPQYLEIQVNGFPMSLLADVAPSSDARYLIALGDPRLRETLAATCDLAGHEPTILVHPRAEVSQWVDIGRGTIICLNCVVTCNVHIGTHVQINIGATVSHDVTIGDYSTLSPGVNISGNVHLGRGVFVGTNASIINGSPGKPLCIGDGAVIAAGACVTKPVEPGAMVAGVPAVRRR
jgi:sugar O-acyltransferase (sialic acid O-acetyltransferase NeuD family)